MHILLTVQNVYINAENETADSTPAMRSDETQCDAGKQHHLDYYYFIA